MRTQPIQATKDGENLTYIPFVGTKLFKKWRKIDDLFVDSSGFGQEGEPAMIVKEFYSQVKAGLAYGVTEAGQFQVFVGVFVQIEKI